MSATVAREAGAPAGDPSFGPPSVPSFVRRNRIWFGVVVAFLAAVALAVWAGQGRTAHPDPLDPRNPGPDGGQALARVLGDQGVEVTIARNADALRQAAPDADSVVVVTGSGALAPSTADRMLDESGRARVVVVQPPYPTLTALTPGATNYAVETPDVAASCTADQRALLPDLRGLRLRVDAADAYPTPGCFPVGDDAYLLTPLRGVSGDRWLFGAGEALTNDQILRADNATIALRLLGERDRLIWYVPDRSDARADESVSLGSLLPDWIEPSLVLLLLAGAALVLWRGRRLGRLSIEPLPVVVRAVETTRSRGRMYRRAGDRAHATRALRAASRKRIADQLGRPRIRTDGDLAALLIAVAEQTGRDEGAVRLLLAPDAPTPTTDHDLVRLAQDLSRLETHMRREVGPR